MTSPYVDRIDLSGKSVFIAGGTSGINLGIAEDFARAGARVAVMSRSQEKVDATVKQLRALGGDVIGTSADVRLTPETCSCSAPCDGRRIQSLPSIPSCSCNQNLRSNRTTL
jgi:short-subunit dehydrogenase